MLIINEEHLLKRIHTLGAVGLDADGRRTRLAASDEDKAGRDLVSRWMRETGLTVVTDYIGNLSGFVPARPIAIGAFTNEEGVRYAPDMMGSLVYAGGYPLEKALASVGTDGTVLGEELRRIGYAGTVEPGFLKPCAFVELHIEQGPILDAEGISIGAVENLQGISWQRVTIEGEQNHAGTTPTAYRVDAGLAAAKVITFLRRRCELPDSCAEEQVLADYLAELERTDRVKITAERLSRFDPVLFDEGIVQLIECSAAARGLSCRRMTSGAGQDAQMLARICPTAMIFVPSVRQHFSRCCGTACRERITASRSPRTPLTAASFLYSLMHKAHILRCLKTIGLFQKRTAVIKEDARKSNSFLRGVMVCVVATKKGVIPYG